MPDQIPNLSGHVVAEGSPATPRVFNRMSHASEVMLDNWRVGHRASDQEHGELLVPKAAAWIQWSGGAYSVAWGKNVSAVARNGTGDVTVTLGITMASILDWGIDVWPGPVSEPIFPKEYDDTAGANTRSATKCRVILQDQLGIAKEASFFITVYGDRDPADVGTPAGVATLDVRNRICKDGVEPAEYRNKLHEFQGAWVEGFGKKHYLDRPTYKRGAHDDTLVPRGVALMRPHPTNLFYPGSTVFSAGFDGTNHEPQRRADTSGNPTIFQVGNVRVWSGHRWVGVRCTPRVASAAGATDRVSIPRVFRPSSIRNLDSEKNAVIDFGHGATTPHLSQYLVVAYGVRSL